MAVIFAFLILLVSPSAFSYPGFIGYGYTTCAMCHYNSQGNGSLTDYGRALFAQEIAARPFIPKSVADEKLAELSGFIPGKELPYWIRPSMKYRGLSLEIEPRGSRSMKRWIVMQRDINLVLALDPDQRSILSLNYGMLPAPMDYYGKGDQSTWISREMYVRTYLSDNFLIAAGLMDKVYGVRIADHTASSRSDLGFGQNDQVHGLYLEWAPESYLTGFHIFTGNMDKVESERQKGFSGTFEFEVAERNRLGFSFADFAKSDSSYQRFAIFDRWGIPGSQGSSIVAELSVKADKDKLTGISKTGTYTYLEGMMMLTRGYFLTSSFDRLQNEGKASAPETRKWRIGLLSFPFQRTEVRASLVQKKEFSTEHVAQDAWSVEGQIHVSL